VSDNKVAAKRFLASPAEEDTSLGQETASMALPQRRLIALQSAIHAWRKVCAKLETLYSRPITRPRILSIVERLDLGPKRSLWVVAYGKRQFLVGCGPETVTAILEVGQLETKDRNPSCANYQPALFEGRLSGEGAPSAEAEQIPQLETVNWTT